MILGFRRYIDKIYVLLGSRVKRPRKEKKKVGTDTLSRNVGKQLQHDAA
jgi:hypothetical protein